MVVLRGKCLCSRSARMLRLTNTGTFTTHNGFDPRPASVSGSTSMRNILTNGERTKFHFDEESRHGTPAPDHTY